MSDIESGATPPSPQAAKLAVVTSHGMGARLWYWLAQSKDQLSALQSLAAIFALVVGAVWVLIHFDIPSELIAEVSLEQTVKAYKALDNATILQVDVTLTNSSKRSATYYCKDGCSTSAVPVRRLCP